jgi:hypothetical protein
MRAALLACARGAPAGLIKDLKSLWRLRLSEWSLSESEMLVFSSRPWTASLICCSLKRLYSFVLRKLAVYSRVALPTSAVCSVVHVSFVTLVR